MLHCRLAGVLAKIQNQVPLDQKSQSLPVVPTRSALLTIFFLSWQETQIEANLQPPRVCGT
jgi:hypothetical protein